MDQATTIVFAITEQASARVVKEFAQSILCAFLKVVCKLELERAINQILTMFSDQPRMFLILFRKLTTRPYLSPLSLCFYLSNHHQHYRRCGAT